jgi:hypothetical protein
VFGPIFGDAARPEDDDRTPGIWYKTSQSTKSSGVAAKKGERAMNRRADRRTGWERGSTIAATAVLAAFGWFSLAGCAEEPPKSTPSKEIKSDSDRFFEKMKQEERERGKDPNGTTR